MKRETLRKIVMPVIGGILTVLFSWQAYAIYSSNKDLPKPNFWSFAIGQFIVGFLIVLFANLTTNALIKNKEHEE